MNQPRDVLMPAQLVVGAGAFERLGAICAREGWRKALIVTGGSRRSAELVAQAARLLEEQGVGAAAYTKLNWRHRIVLVISTARQLHTGPCRGVEMWSCAFAVPSSGIGIIPAWTAILH